MDLNLDDVFSGVFFSPDGDLLDIPSDGDESLNLTLSSTSISEGTTHTPFAQFAVLSGRPGDGDAAAAAAAGGVSAEAAAAGAGEAIGEGAGVMPSVTRSSHQLRDLLNLPGGGQGSMMDIDDSGAAAWVGPQLIGAAPGVVAGLSPQGAFVGGGGALVPRRRRRQRRRRRWQLPSRRERRSSWRRRRRSRRFRPPRRTHRFVSALDLIFGVCGIRLAGVFHGRGKAVRFALTADTPSAFLHVNVPACSIISGSARQQCMGSAHVRACGTDVCVVVSLAFLLLGSIDLSIMQPKLVKPPPSCGTTK